MRTPDPGSFRDPTSQVVREDDRILRQMRGAGAEGWRTLTGSGLLSTLVEAGKLVRTREIRLDRPQADDGWEVMLEHDRVPFVSYPYEWPFSMLRDAAKLQLEILLEALRRGVTVKDATPYNVQWWGARPVFIDVGSFKPLEDGEPWLGYRQFCMQFLFPLMLRAYRDVSFQPWLRGSLDGLSASDLRQLLRWRDRVRRATLLHVGLQARAERRESSKSESARAEVRRAGFRKELIEANARGLARVIEGLTWRPRQTAWSGYADQHAHVAHDRGPKTDFVKAVLRDRRFRLIWDLGANDGHFSRIAADHAQQVVAMDVDEATVDALYLRLRDEGAERVLPLLVDLADPSPSLGWACIERPDLASRGRPEVVLCLAVFHHLAIGRNIPPEGVVAWLAQLGAEVILEFAEPDDPMVRRLTLNKQRDEIHSSYNLEALRKLLAESFETVRDVQLPSGSRTLLHLRPRL